MTGFMGLTFSAFAGICFVSGLAVLDGLHIGYQKKKTYHRGHSVECLFTFRWACAYRYDNSERGGRR